MDTRRKRLQVSNADVNGDSIYRPPRPAGDYSSQTIHYRRRSEVTTDASSPQHGRIIVISNYASPGSPARATFAREITQPDGRPRSGYENHASSREDYGRIKIGGDENRRQRGNDETRLESPDQARRCRGQFVASTAQEPPPVRISTMMAKCIARR